MAHGSRSARMADLEQIVEAVVSRLGLDLEAVELTDAGRRSVLTVAIDTDGGIGIDEITAATREVSRELDDTDVMGEQPYTLEVTSRGVSRPLVLPRHWRRNVGRLVTVTRTDGTTTDGRIAAGPADDDAAPAATLTTKTGEQTLPLADVDSALVQVELNRKDA